MPADVLYFPSMARFGPRPEGTPRPNRIMERRKEAGLTMEQLAGRVNITRGHLSNLENGKRELTWPVMERIAAALDVLPADLLNPTDGGLSEVERFLINTYREVPEAMRKAFNAVAESQQPFRGASEVVGLDADEKDRRKA